MANDDDSGEVSRDETLSASRHGFRTRNSLGVHFEKHAPRLKEFLPQFDWSDEYQYEGHAEIFMWGPCSVTCRQCRNGSNEVVRFDIATNEFGVVSNDGYIKTYYIPDPAEHEEINNRVYFEKNCVRYEDCKH